MTGYKIRGIDQAGFLKAMNRCIGLAKINGQFTLNHNSYLAMYCVIKSKYPFLINVDLTLTVRAGRL